MFRSEISSPDLSDIIGLYPEDEPWCAGYAPSQGRRCKCRTNAANRRTASALLDRGTTYLKQGMCMDDILKNLAPLVLCTRFHQYQSDGLAEGWILKMNKFQQRQTPIPPTPPRTPNADTVTPWINYTSVETRTTVPGFYYASSSVPSSFSAFSFGVSQNRYAGADHPRQNVSPWQTGPDVTAQHRQTQSMFRQGAERRTPRPVVSSSVVENIPSILVASGEPAEPASERERRSASPSPPSRVIAPSSESVSTAEITETRPVSASTDTRTAPEPDYITPAAARPTRNVQPRRNGPAGVNGTESRRIVRRRPIEGNCAICILPLLHDPDEDASDRNSSDDENDGNPEPEVQITWCKAQCGKNYHKSCMDTWIDSCRSLARGPTCPNCRTSWR
jgi:hypothetical protein